MLIFLSPANSAWSIEATASRKSSVWGRGTFWIIALKLDRQYSVSFQQISLTPNFFSSKLPLTCIEYSTTSPASSMHTTSCSGTECNHIFSWLGFTRQFLFSYCHSMPLVLFLNLHMISNPWIAWNRVSNTTHKSQPRISCFNGGGTTKDKIDPVLMLSNHSGISPRDRKQLILTVAINSYYITSWVASYGPKSQFNKTRN